MIQLVAFLGNYGHEYAHTRHNTAWLFQESLSMDITSLSVLRFVRARSEF